jgi:dTDP-4-amino-4,6-dideoxygalactose transaminase
MPDPDDLPAILGGVPAFPDGPPAWPPAWQDVRAALDAASAGGSWGQYHGPHVRALEELLGESFGVPHVLTCASGTLAVEAALRAVGVGPGDEVILAAYDYEANYLNVHAIGAKPVLIDVDADSWQLDPDRLEAAVTPATKAVICSHLHGGLVPMRDVLAVAEKHVLAVIEDAAQAPGADLEGRKAGAWGHVGTLSFGGSKLLTAGRGGALLLRDARLFHRAKVWLSRGVQQWAPLSELQAAVLRPQLAALAGRTADRFRFVRSLCEAIGRNDVPGLRPLCNERPGTVAAFYKLGFQYDPGGFGLPRELFVRAMRVEGVAFDPGFNALHAGRSPSRFRAVGELTHATRAHERCVLLHHPVLLGPVADAVRVARAVAKVYRNADRVQAAPA